MHLSCLQDETARNLVVPWGHRLTVTARGGSGGRGGDGGKGGEGGTGLRGGDRIAVEPGVPCGRCETCKRGRYKLCPDVDFLGSPPQVHGAFREYMAFPTMTVFKLPDALSLEEGA